MRKQTDIQVKGNMEILTTKQLQQVKGGSNAQTARRDIIIVEDVY